jgi:RNA polymerase sigma-70 factor (ECF subfamily)
MIDACDERGRGEFLSVLADPATTFDVNEHIRLCLGCVGRTLEPEVAAALVLREMFELSNDECAEIAGVTESVHRHRLSEARTHMTREFDNLCALVRKDGPCHQCTTLRDAAPPSQRGPELPAQPITFDDRLRIARGVGEGGTAYAALETYFHRALAERDH